MKQLFLSLGIVVALTAHAQSETLQDSSVTAETKAGYVYLHRKIPNERLIVPYDLEVTYDKTVHILFPAPVKYVDLGSSMIIADVAQGAENVLRVKAAQKDFTEETNLSVVTEDGTFYNFNVAYGVYPYQININMEDKRGNHPPDVFPKAFAGATAQSVDLTQSSIYYGNKKRIKNIGSKRFGISFLLKGIYTDGNLLYFHTEIRNKSVLPFDVDFIRWKIVDKKIAKRTAVQENFIQPVSSFNEIKSVNAKYAGRTVWALQRFTIPDDKQLVVELFEKNGGRHQSFTIDNEALMQAASPTPPKEGK